MPRLETARHGRAVVVTIEGDIDRLSATVVRSAVEEATGGDAIGVVCDLSAVDYLDSSGVHLFHDLARALRRSGQRLLLVRPRRRTPAEVIRLTGLHEAAPLHDDVDSALAAVAG